jgi:hypothetical protein
VQCTIVSRRLVAPRVRPLLDVSVRITRSCKRETRMRMMQQTRFGQRGAVGWVLLWLLGVPIPILLVLFLLRGCT